MCCFRRRHRANGAPGARGGDAGRLELMLEDFPEVRHVYLASGSCLPLRPCRNLKDYLAARPRTDFIESATTADVPWTVGGLDEERFTLRFPFSWRKHRRLFDRYVGLQRRLRLYKRKIPDGTRAAHGQPVVVPDPADLSAILRRPGPRRCMTAISGRSGSRTKAISRPWHGSIRNNIESRSLTLSKFDFQGKPHIFYDDHLQLLRRSDCFVARKIWPHADRLLSGISCNAITAAR